MGCVGHKNEADNWLGVFWDNCSFWMISLWNIISEIEWGNDNYEFIILKWVKKFLDSLFYKNKQSNIIRPEIIILW
jgi:hypothetical protein